MTEPSAIEYNSPNKRRLAYVEQDRSAQMEVPVSLEGTVVLVGAALLAIDKFLAILKARGVDLPRVAKQIDELHEWHNVTGENGVKIWYDRNKKTAERLNRMEQVLEKQLDLLVRMDMRLELLENTLVRRVTEAPKIEDRR